MMTAERKTEIMAQVPPGARVIAVCVPTNAFRVIAMPGDKLFRVEQLEPVVWTWRALSSHQGTDEFEAFGVALQDAINKQEEFKQIIIRQQIEQRQAQRLADANALTSGDAGASLS